MHFQLQPFYSQNVLNASRCRIFRLADLEHYQIAVACRLISGPQSLLGRTLLQIGLKLLGVLTEIRNLGLLDANVWNLSLVYRPNG